ncbi:LysR family transcriptional regulator [Rhizobium oryzicola]|uniref:LysR family transcriptional regulator n=1 Tax=Rhizobium oryzicola TaxID=1232668 RepID=A0ABT8SVC3_9HYPH|nr:LysR family transcriptional regulator [Rhizobium oryzicola]MDO1582357.1 LysR family transcriptional regulator [Rhizobium oryzicola]
MNEPDWNLYRTFLAVMRKGSLSAAAREVGLTQPTVGRHIDELEVQLGRSLFTRSQQGLLPTDTARALLPFAETLAATSASLMRQLSGRADRVEGVVRITASEIIGVEVLPQILRHLQWDYPDLTIELSLSDSVEDLLRREADIAVRMTRPAQDALVARHVGEIELGLHAHPDYLERFGTPQNLADLAQHSMIGFDRKTAFIRSTAKDMQSLMPDFPSLDDIEWSYRTDSNLGQLTAIRAGLGIGICQVQLARRAPTLQRLLPEFRFPLPTWVAMHEDLKTAPRCRATFDALVTGLRDYVTEAGRA